MSTLGERKSFNPIREAKLDSLLLALRVNGF